MIPPGNYAVWPADDDGYIHLTVSWPWTRRKPVVVRIDRASAEGVGWALKKLGRGDDLQSMRAERDALNDCIAALEEEHAQMEMAA